MTRDGFKEVTKDEFYKAMGPLNVHPCPVGSYINGRGYMTEWKLHGGVGAMIGLSDYTGYWIKT